jgi:hypothetical protein
MWKRKMVVKITKLEIFSATSKVIGVFMLSKAIEAVGNFGTSFVFLNQIPQKIQSIYLIISFSPLIIFFLLSFIFIKASSSIAQKLCGSNEGNAYKSENLNHQVLLQVMLFSIGIFILVTTIPKLSGILLLVFQGIFSSDLLKDIVETGLSLVLGGMLTFFPKVFQNFADRRIGKK